MEFEFNRFKKVIDSVGQSDYHSIKQYASKIKIKKFKTLQSVSPVIGIIRGILLKKKKIPQMIPITGETDYKVLNFLILIFDAYCVMLQYKSYVYRIPHKSVVLCANA